MESQGLDLRLSLPFPNHMACINESISLDPSFLNYNMEIRPDFSILKGYGEDHELQI